MSVGCWQLKEVSISWADVCCFSHFINVGKKTPATSNLTLIGSHTSADLKELKKVKWGGCRNKGGFAREAINKTTTTTNQTKTTKKSREGGENHSKIKIGRSELHSLGFYVLQAVWISCFQLFRTLLKSPRAEVALLVAGTRWIKTSVLVLSSLPPGEIHKQKVLAGCAGCQST